MKRNILTGVFLSFVLQFSIAQDPGFFLDGWSEKTAIIPDTQFVVKTTKTPTVTIRVDGGQVVGKVPQYIYGNNAVTWNNGLRSNSTAMTDLRNLNPHECAVQEDQPIACGWRMSTEPKPERSDQ